MLRITLALAAIVACNLVKAILVKQNLTWASSKISLDRRFESWLEIIYIVNFVAARGQRLPEVLAFDFQPSDCQRDVMTDSPRRPILRLVFQAHSFLLVHFTPWYAIFLLEGSQWQSGTTFDLAYWIQLSQRPLYNHQ